MANVNKVILVGRFTRDPEVKTFNNGGKVCAFGFAVSNRKKNQSTGQWEDEPCFIDCEAFNRGEHGKTADLLSEVRKGQQVYLEGHLKLDQWKDKTSGDPRSKLKLVVDTFQYLEKKQEGGGQQAASQPRAQAPGQQQSTFDQAPPGYDSYDGGAGGEEIPFAWLLPWLLPFAMFAAMASAIA